MAVVALALQARMGIVVLTSSLTDADGPTHYATGVMVYDYLRHPFGVAPLPFAETFYVKYPKIAFGHWPPALYALQAAWFSLLGPGIVAARLLSVATATAIAVCLALRMRRDRGAVLAVGGAAVFASLPSVQTLAWTVGSDLLVAGFMLGALLALSDLLALPDRRSAIRFGLWSGAALLTKGSAWAIGPAALMAPLLYGRLSCYRHRWYYASGVIACAIGAPFHLIAQQQGVGYPGDYERLTSLALPLASRWSAVQPFLNVVPPVFGVVALVGLLASVRLRWVEGDTSRAVRDDILAGTLVLGQVIFLFVLPLTEETRVFLPSLAAAVFPFARGVTVIHALARPGGSMARLVPAGVVLLTIAAGGVAVRNRTDGYREAADAVPFPAEGTLVLVSATGDDEGTWIAERLSRDPRRAGVILRASNLLAESYWSGSGYRLRVKDVAAVKRLVIDGAIRYIVIIRKSTDPVPAHQQLLEDALEDDPDTFPLKASVSLRSTRPGQDGRIAIFENRLAGAGHPPVVRVRLGLDRGGRVLTYDWR